LNSQDVISSTISSITAGGNANDLITKTTSGANTLASALAGGKDKLSDLASAGLPPGLAAKLAANMNSLNKSGSDPIMMPAIGEGTVDRSEITASIGAVLGDKKITMPNFSGEISAAVTAQADNISSILAQADTLQKQRDDQYTAYATARDALYSSIENLPEGDPAILAAKATAAVEYDKLTALSTQISDLINSA
jgi:hypothetical protein